jgi:hypothetical protein
MDEIFESRRVHKPPTASRLVRVAEPPITWRRENSDLTLDDYLARHPTTGLLMPRATAFSSSATSTAVPTAIGSSRSRSARS